MSERSRGDVDFFYTERILLTSSLGSVQGQFEHFRWDAMGGAMPGLRVAAHISDLRWVFQVSNHDRQTLSSEYSPQMR